MAPHRSQIFAALEAAASAGKPYLATVSRAGHPSGQVKTFHLVKIVSNLTGI